MKHGVNKNMISLIITYQHNNDNQTRHCIGHLSNILYAAGYKIQSRNIFMGFLKIYNLCEVNVSHLKLIISSFLAKIDYQIELEVPSHVANDEYFDYVDEDIGV